MARDRFVVASRCGKVLVDVRMRRRMSINDGKELYLLSADQRSGPNRHPVRGKYTTGYAAVGVASP